MKRIFLISILGMLLAFGTSGAQVSEPSLEAGGELEMLEALAARHIQDGRPDIALDVYRRYEAALAARGGDVLSPDLLMNQAIAAYRAGRYGEASAYLKQRSLRDDDVLSRQMRDELQSLIEHGVYQRSPHHAFVRGEPEGFLAWKYTHQISASRARLHIFICWSVCCILGAVLLRFRKRTCVLAIAGGVLFVFLILLAESTMFYVDRKRGDGDRYGVLLDDLEVRAEAVNEGTVLKHDEFIPGMTVQVLTTRSGWAKVMRVDGLTGWVDEDDVYILRGAGVQKTSRPSLNLRPRRARIR